MSDRKERIRCRCGAWIPDELVMSSEVQRVLDAARAFSKMWDALGLGPDPAANRSPELLELLAAAHALDAPRERYRPRFFILEYSQGVWINDATLAGAKDIRIGSAQTREHGEMICAALNAQERKP